MNTGKKGMKVKMVKAIRDDFDDNIGPSTVTHVFLSLDGMLFELGRFYKGPNMSEGTDKHLDKILEFENLCKEVFPS